MTQEKPAPEPFKGGRVSQTQVEGTLTQPVWEGGPCSGLRSLRG